MSHWPAVRQLVIGLGKLDVFTEHLLWGKVTTTTTTTTTTTKQAKIKSLWKCFWMLPYPIAWYLLWLQKTKGFYLFKNNLKLRLRLVKIYIPGMFSAYSVVRCAAIVFLSQIIQSAYELYNSPPLGQALETAFSTNSHYLVMEYWIH